MRKNTGFTLIEILVVLIIVAIITAVAVMAFGQFGRGRREKIIVDQFVRIISVAQQQAILTPEVLGLSVNDDGYRYFQYEKSLSSKRDKWMPLRNDVFSRAQAFKNIFKTNTKSKTALDSKKNYKTQPEILFLPSGYVTPFVLNLKGSEYDFIITVKNNGVVAVKAELHAKK